MRDGHQSETRVFKPDTPPSSGPRLIALLLGGGFAIGSNLQLVPIARALASIYSAIVVTLSYRRAPEHDTWDSAQWLAQRAPTEVGADLAAGFVLGGDISGAQPGHCNGAPSNAEGEGKQAKTPTSSPHHSPASGRTSP